VGLRSTLPESQCYGLCSLVSSGGQLLQKQEAGGKPGSRTPFSDELLDMLQVEHPWLTRTEIMELLKMNSPQASVPEPRAGPLPSGASSSTGGASSTGASALPGGASSSSSTGQGSSRHVVMEIPEDLVASVNDNIEAIRAEVAQGNVELRSYFNLKALGGTWSIEQGKAITTDFQSIAKDKSIAKWCEKTLFPERKSFSTRLYGHLNARMLAEEVLRRGKYFFGAWVDAGSEVPYDYNPLVAGYRSSVEYEQWFEDLPLNSASVKAAFEIWEMVPYPLLE
jgi:hypothetical protein